MEHDSRVAPLVQHSKIVRRRAYRSVALERHVAAYPDRSAPSGLQNFDGSTDVRLRDPGLDVAPQRHALHHNTPNPFNPTTQIAFDLARDGHVTLRVFDVAGKHVRTLVDEERARQRYRVVGWTG